MAANAVVTITDDPRRSTTSGRSVILQVDGVTYVFNLSLLNAIRLLRPFEIYLEQGHRLTAKPKGLTGIGTAPHSAGRHRSHLSAQMAFRPIPSSIPSPRKHSADHTSIPSPRSGAHHLSGAHI